MANSERFKILKKFVYEFASGAGVSGAYARGVRNMDWYAKLNLPVEYSSTTGAITEIKSNNIFLLASTANQTDDEITVTATCRLRFTDL